MKGGNSAVMAGPSNNMALDLNQTGVARRQAVDTYQSAPRAKRADYLKLAVWLALIFVPWAAIAFAAKLVIESH
jgi:hypothetical protein